MTTTEAIIIVIKLAEANWLHRAWRLYRLTEQEKQAIRRVSQCIEHGVFEKAFKGQ